MSFDDSNHTSQQGMNALPGLNAAKPGEPGSFRGIAARFNGLTSFSSATGVGFSPSPDACTAETSKTELSKGTSSNMRGSTAALGQRHTGGVTLVELLVAMVASGIILVGLARLLTGMIDQYSMQVHMAELNQNTQYALNYLREQLLQVGADLPDSGIAVVTQASVGEPAITTLRNPNSGVQVFTNIRPSSRVIPVDNARGFVSRDGRELLLVRKPYDRRLPVELLGFDNAYSSPTGSFADGVDTLHDSVALNAEAGFNRGDVLYAYQSEEYHMANETLYHDSSAVIDGIDSVAIVFVDTTGSATRDWDDMWGVELTVRGVAAKRLAQYREYPDGRPRMLCTTRFRLRNRTK